MALVDFVLFQLARRWPSPLVYQDDELDKGEPDSKSYNLAYARHQFNYKVRNGISENLWNLDVLEIGCGHGGNSCFMAMAGARSVTAIDINIANLSYGQEFAGLLARRFGADFTVPVSFLATRAEQMPFPDSTFDLVLADNLFEHVDDPQGVMKEGHRVLRSGGILLVPVFSSILSKYGLHLKYGFNLPWANVLFSEDAIIRALHRLAATDPKMLVFYPGLAGECKRIRDVRRHRDLNDITFKKFKLTARQTGFEIVSFQPVATLTGWFARRLPIIRNSVLMDVWSFGASACLKKI
jgi:ubiquinone/menaquinone biosynthesis C-methylase UbiE